MDGELKKGDPVTMRMNPPDVDPRAYGRFLESDGGIFVVVTPGGSELRSGMVWVRPIAEGSEEEKMLEFWEKPENLGAGATLYGGAFDEPASKDPSA